MTTMLNVATAGAALRAKLNDAKGVGRADMYLADVMPVSASEAKLLIGYSPRNPVPTHEQVSACVAASTGRLTKSGPLTVNLETLANHPVNSVQAAVSVLVTSPRLVANLSAKDKMVVVSSTMFYDDAMKANWEIKSRADGVQFLECTRKENVPELLNTAIASQGVLNKAVSFATPEIVATAALQCSVGDFVEFWAGDGLRRGDVTKVNGDELTIQGDDKPWNVPAGAVSKILRLNVKAQNAEENRQLAMYTALWGPDFAKQLVKMNANTNGGSK